MKFLIQTNTEKLVVVDCENINESIEQINSMLEVEKVSVILGTIRNVERLGNSIAIVVENEFYFTDIYNYTLLSL